LATVTDNIQDFKRFVQANPHTGTTQQIVELSLLISTTAELLKKDKGTYALYQEAYEEASGVGSKVFSKLKKIGDTFKQFNEKDRKQIISSIPASYQTIYGLCTIKTEEILTAVKRKHITPQTTVKSVGEYVKQIKHPGAVATDGEKGRWGSKQEHLFSVLRPAEMPLEGEALQTLEKALRRLCTEYGVSLRKASTSSLTTLKEEERERAGAFWKAVLEKQVTEKWFMEQTDKLKKQFNLKTVDELRSAPNRSFTGFFNKAGETKEVFWENHGKAYIAKLEHQLATTTDRANRYWCKNRIEEICEKHPKLAAWRNIVLKDSGLI
jgi:hypothetical protein